MSLKVANVLERYLEQALYLANKGGMSMKKDNEARNIRIQKLKEQ